MIGVRIVAGVKGERHAVELHQEATAIRVEIGSGETRLTVAAARELARQIYMIARRVEIEGAKSRPPQGEPTP